MLLRDCKLVNFDSFSVINVVGARIMITVENSYLSMTDFLFQNTITSAPYIMQILSSPQIVLNNINVFDFYPIFLVFSYSSLNLTNAIFQRFQMLGTLETTAVEAEYVVEFYFRNCSFSSLQSSTSGPVTLFHINLFYIFYLKREFI